MTFWTLIRRSLRFHARAHLGVVLGATVGSAALIGALVVGDSVRESLRQMALRRLGAIHFALQTPDRLFRQDLRQRLSPGPTSGPVRVDSATPSNGSLSSAGPLSSALVLPGVVVRQDGAARANRVNVVGIETPAWPHAERGWPRFAGWNGLSAGEPSKDHDSNRFQGSDTLLQQWQAGETAFINETLARQLGARPGDEIIVRVRKPTALGLDAALSPRDESAQALRLKIGAILSPEMLGDFSLSAQQIPPANLFLPLSFLAEKVGAGGRANLLVAGPVGAGSLSWLEGGLQRAWRLEDAELSVRAVEPPPGATGGESLRPFVEVTSTRVFLEPPVVAAALMARTRLLTNHQGFEADTPQDVSFSRFVTNGVGVLTYLANLIRAGDRATPYSMVAAVDGRWLPPQMRDDEVLVNEWLAEDLEVKPGDKVELSYYVVDSGSRLIERTNSFRVRATVPLRGIYADRTLMPEFPGLAKAESTHDWDAGFPLVYKIRDKDEAYWKGYRGTPKAFLTLAAGQALWGNRFGALTAVRYEAPSNSVVSAYRDAAYRNLLANLEPADLGLRFQPVRQEALEAAQQSQDFGQLFLGFSIFLVVAALLLMALLFQFGLEQRVTEVGTLLAVGFTARQVRRLLLVEGVALALAGGCLGALGGLAYAKAMLWGLTTVWRSAVSTAALQFHATPATLFIGTGASTVVAALTIWLTLRRQAREPAVALLAAELETPKVARGSWGAGIGSAAALGAGAELGWAWWANESANAGVFFGAGALLLTAGLAFAAALLSALARTPGSSSLTLGALGLRGCARRRTRSLATLALLACGCFVVAALGVFRLDANRDATRRSSGTGGFALLGETTLPVAHDLNTRAGREFFGLSAEELAGVAVVPFRVRAGDDASCLNLNRARQPRLLGVRPELLAGRFTLAKAADGLDRRSGWQLLKAQPEERREKLEGRNHGVSGPTRPSPLFPSPSVALAETSAPDEVPAIGDANSIEWALGKKVGDTLDYTDERGRTFKLRLVGAVANSILQGSLMIDEAQFVQRFPRESGYRLFLLDVRADGVARVSATLSRALQDVGLELTPTVQRLAAFNAVQNTYLSTFQVLGGLGLLLGSAGLGVVVLRNVLERRGELGLLAAVGFRRRALQGLVLAEHGALLAAGLGLGLVAAAVAVLPALLSPGRTQLPWASLALTLGGVWLNGLVWTWLATRYALRGNLLEALRNE